MEPKQLFIYREETGRVKTTGDSTELFKVVAVQNALKTTIKHTPQPELKRETVALEEGLGRFLADDIVSQEKVPPFDRSIMDGYAVRSKDTFGATEGNPAYLELMGRVPMGELSSAVVGTGEALAISTGGALPGGADAVVMVEHSNMLDESTIEALRAVAPGDNVAKAGEDIEIGEVVLRGGHRLKAPDLGALAALGENRVQVYRPIKVGILSSGDEIVDAGDKPAPGQVRDINYYTLSGMIRQSGAEPVRLGICPDNAGELRERLSAGVRKCQVLVTSGSSSVGVADMMPNIIKEMGKPGVLVHGVSLKPGKPALTAVVDGIPIFGLPGHPLSALDIYRLLVDPVIEYLYRGDEALTRLRPQVRARIGRSIASVAGREDRVRVILEKRGDELWAQPILGKSGLISLAVRATGVAVVPHEAEGIENGDEIVVELF